MAGPKSQPRTRRRAKAETVIDPFSTADSVMDAMFQNMAEKLGSDECIMTQQQSEERIIGIPLPSLALAYIFQNDVLPFGRSLTLNGLQAGGKSSLMTEIMRWHNSYAGVSNLIENETKDYPDIRQGIFLHDEQLLRRIKIVQTAQVEEWQTAMTVALDNAKKFMKTAGKRATPVCIGLDSVAGKLARGQSAKISESGSASRGYSDVALLTSQYMQDMPRKLINMPVTIIGIQHLKKDKDPKTGINILSTPGARAIKFFETFEIEVTRKKPIELVDEGGVHTTLTTRKNSMGPYPRSINVIFRWWWSEHPVTGQWVQWFVWDWYDATIEMLVNFAKDQKTLYNRINQVVDLHPMKSRRRIWSRELGIPESDPVTYHDAGAILESRGDVLVELYKLLGIHRRRRFRMGEDMMTLCNEPIPAEIPPSTAYRPVGHTLSEEAEQQVVTAEEPEEPEELEVE